MALDAFLRSHAPRYSRRLSRQVLHDLPRFRSCRFRPAVACRPASAGRRHASTPSPASMWTPPPPPRPRPQRRHGPGPAQGLPDSLSPPDPPGRTGRASRELDAAALLRLSRGYTIANERRSTTRYVADVTYMFNPDAVRARCCAAPASPLPRAQAKRILVMPMSPGVQPWPLGPGADARRRFRDSRGAFHGGWRRTMPPA